nr:hypothetical protein [Clostridioides difficile]
MTNIFKERLANGESIDDILPEAFAVVREVSHFWILTVYNNAYTHS